jgi:hypothetical protein
VFVHIGAAKLGLSEATGCTLVLEEDGTVIDADEILLECVSKPLIILRQNETWKPAGEDVATLANVNQHVGVIQQAATPSPLREQTSYPTTTQLPTLPGSPTAERELASLDLCDSTPADEYLRVFLM